MSILHDDAVASPAVDEPVSGEPLWEQTRRPAWVKAVNAAGSGLRRIGVRWPRIEPEGLMAAARRRTGLRDFGDDAFREGLRVLVDTFNGLDNTNAFGRLFFKEYCTSLLANRLKIQADLTRHPEILDVPVRRPLFITGLPRSGTTFLHRLMSQDPDARAMLFWEALEPSPPPTPATYKTDPRIARARRQMDLLYSLSPRLATAHEFEAESPEEDNNLFAHRFSAGMLGFMFDVPAYSRWLGEQPLVPGYAYEKQQLQLLSWKYPGDHWVLKSPGHLFGLDAILAVFPDACIVVTHREPKKVIPSVSSLAAGFRGILTDRLDLRRLGAEMSEAMSLGPRRAIDVRASADPARFFDVGYDGLVAEPIETVRAICDHFGYDFTPGFEARARAWYAANPRQKHGVHRYRLDDFGLTPAHIEADFAEYYDWLAHRSIAVHLS